MGLIHMPARVDARLHTEGADQSGVTLEIHHTDFILALKTQILSRDIHKDGKPLWAPRMPEHKEIRIPGKKMLSNGTVGIHQVGS